MSEYDDFEVFDAEPPWASELTEIGGPVRLPETAEEFRVAADTLQHVQRTVVGSPGASAHFAEAQAQSTAFVVDQIETLAQKMGAGVVVDRPAAYAHASELYDACLRAGDTPDAAEAFAYDKAVKKATGTRSYKDVTDEWQKRTFGKKVEVQPRKDFRSR
jgi:hypothetical protein